MAVVGLVFRQAALTLMVNMELVAVGDAIAQVINQLKDRRVVEVAVLGEFVAQRQECAHRPGTKKIALEALIGTQKVEMVAEIEGMESAVLPLNFARGILAQ